jgi:hypothetical protein
MQAGHWEEYEYIDHLPLYSKPSAPATEHQRKADPRAVLTLDRQRAQRRERIDAASTPLSGTGP